MPDGKAALFAKNRAALEKRKDGQKLIIDADEAALFAKNKAALQKRKDGQKLIDAADDGTLETVVLLIEGGVDVDSVDRVGQTGLFCAAYEGHIKIVKVLINAGAAVDKVDNDGRTPLDCASSEGKTDCVNALLLAGADPAKAGYEKRKCEIALEELQSPIRKAAEGGKLQVLLSLIESSRFDVDFADMSKRTGLYWASNNGHVECVNVLLLAGAEPAKADEEKTKCETAQKEILANPMTVRGANLFSVLKSPLITGFPAERLAPVVAAIKDVNAVDETNGGATVLMNASSEGHGVVVSTLLTKVGIEVNKTDNDGNTALIMAFTNGHTPIVTALIAGGADVNVTDKKGQTALLWASARGDTTAVTAVLAADGVDVNKPDADGNAAMIVAFTNGRTPNVTALIAAGADVNIANKAGKTILLLASAAGNTTAVAAVLAADDVDVNKPDADGNTALILAFTNGHTPNVTALIAAGADVNIANKAGKTILLLASAAGNTTSVAAVLGADGVDVHKPDADGNTALILALNNGNPAIVSALAAAGADVNVVNKEGKSALKWAVAEGHGDVVTALVAASADVNVEYPADGSTTLMDACSKGDRGVVEMLLAADEIDVNKSDNGGKAAVDYALAQVEPGVEDSVHWQIVNALFKSPGFVMILPDYDQTQLFLKLIDTASLTTVLANAAIVADVGANSANLHPNVLSEDADHPQEFVPISSRPGGLWLKRQWERLDDTSTPRVLWETVYAISRLYFDGCIEAASPQDQTELLQVTYSEMRDQHKGMYESTMASVKRDTNFETYSSVLAGVRSHVTLRFADKPGAQRSDELWNVYVDARAIQERYERFMAMLSEKTGCAYAVGKRKNPFRAIEKLGLALEQWIASKVKDIVRGAQVMPDVGKGLQLLELLVACDPSEAEDAKTRGWNAKTAGITEEICIVGVKDRWVAATSGGWSDALLTFYFLDDPSKHVCEVQLVHTDMMRVRKQMGAHKGYSAFRCALELLEATGYANLIAAIEAKSDPEDCVVAMHGSASAAAAAAAGSLADVETSAAAVAAFERMEARLEARLTAKFETRLKANEVQIAALQQEIYDLKTQEKDGGAQRALPQLPPDNT